MTVKNQVDKVVMPGNDSAIRHPFSPMVIFQETDLEVTYVDADGNETLLALGTGSTNYAVEVARYPGTGNVVYPADESTPLPTGHTLITKRVLPLAQPVELESQGPYDASVQEGMHDRGTMIDIQLQEEINRSIKASISYQGNPLVLPPAEPEALIGWNETADGLTNYQLASLPTAEVTPWSLDWLKLTSDTEARNTLDTRILRFFNGIPGPNEDSTQGYAPLDTLVDQNTGTNYRCLDATPGSALWVELQFGGGGGGGGGVAPGTITAWPNVSPPPGALLCNGQTINAVANPQFTELWNILGTTFGGTGNDDFNLPDIRGRTIFMPGQAVEPNPKVWTLAEQYGLSVVQLTEAEMPSHTHPPSVGSVYISNGSGTWPTDLGSSGSGASAQSTGGDQPHENIPPGIGINWIIWYEPVGGGAGDGDMKSPVANVSIGEVYQALTADGTQTGGTGLIYTDLLYNLGGVNAGHLIAFSSGAGNEVEDTGILQSRLALRDINNTFSVSQSIETSDANNANLVVDATGGSGAAAATVQLIPFLGTANQRGFQWRAINDSFQLDAINDAGTIQASLFSIDWAAGGLSISAGDLNVSGGDIYDQNGQVYGPGNDANLALLDKANIFSEQQSIVTGPTGFANVILDSRLNSGSGASIQFKPGFGTANQRAFQVRVQQGGYILDAILDNGTIDRSILSIPWVAGSSIGVESDLNINGDLTESGQRVFSPNNVVPNDGMAVMPAFTLKGRTGGSDVPEDFRIDALPPTSPTSGDAILAQQAGTGILIRINPDDLGGPGGSGDMVAPATIPAGNLYMAGATPQDAEDSGVVANDLPDINRNHQPGGVLRFAVVSSLPGTTDPNTIYFVTT